MHRTLTLLISALLFVASLANAADLPTNNTAATTGSGAENYYYGHITSNGQPVKGAMVTVFHGKPVHSLTVFADDEGRYLTPKLPWPDGYSLRVRRAGWQDFSLNDKSTLTNALSAGNHGTEIDVAMERITDPRQMIDQLPGNYWMSLVLDEMKDHPDQLR